MYEPISGEGRAEGGENESVEWNGAELVVKRMLHAEGKAETNAQINKPYVMCGSHNQLEDTDRGRVQEMRLKVRTGLSEGT